MTRIAIIGAGLAGLTAANGLKHIADITVFEKSRGVGGRMSTRRAEPYVFDHGAQFFKVRSDAFKSFILPMIDDGVVARWDAHCVEIVGETLTRRQQWGEDDPHYVGVPSMNALAKWLSRDLTVHYCTRVHAMIKQGNQWRLHAAQGEPLGDYDWVISSVPAGQAATLLPPSLTFHHRIQSATMQSCFALMLGFEHMPALGFDAALVQSNDISWISVNNTKPGRHADGGCLLIHSTSHWADAHIDDHRDHVLDYLCRQTSAITGCDTNLAGHKAVHGWRYANIETQTQHGETHLIDLQARIGVCGDWLIQGQVEAAFTSGDELANHLSRVLKDD